MCHRYCIYSISYSRRIFDGEWVESRTGGDGIGRAGARGATRPTILASVAGVTDGTADERIVYEPVVTRETAGIGVAGKGRMGAPTCSVAPAKGKLVDGIIKWYGRGIVSVGHHRGCRFIAFHMGDWQRAGGRTVAGRDV